MEASLHEIGNDVPETESVLNKAGRKLPGHAADGFALGVRAFAWFLLVICVGLCKEILHFY
jgi:hypothetical protein